MTQYPYPQPFQQYDPRLLCPQCGTELSPALLSCPKCHRLVHADRLNHLAAEAKAASDAGDPSIALARWRDAAGLLPRESKQFAAVMARIEELSRAVDAQGSGVAQRKSTNSHSGSAVGKVLGAGGAAALLLWKFKFALTFLLTKGKLLLLGLTKVNTLFSMLLSIGVYWAAFGWKFALGLVLSIYIHEMGHVAMLMRYGMKASAPMFIPGLGALIMLKQHPTSPREDARIGLAGPTWGLAASVGAWLVALATGWPSWAAIAKVAGWLNLFNLIPVWQLDGSRGFRALSRSQRWIVVATMAAMFFVTTDGMLGIIAAVAAFRAFGEKEGVSAEGDRGAFYLFAFLVITLALMSEIRVPGMEQHY